MLQTNINGKSREFGEGISILDALGAMGIEVPTLCHDKRLKPIGGCRLCVVNVQGWSHPATACNTLLTDGMVIETHTPELEVRRRTVLRLLAQRYPAAPVRQFPDKEFHRTIRAYGLENDLLGKPDPDLADDSHPYIGVDMSQCVSCYRCVRICEELQGQFVWQIWNRGAATLIRPDSGTTLMESSCVGCGACVDTCPTGALEDKPLLTHGHPASWTRTTCAYCGTGCEMNVGARDGRIDGDDRRADRQEPDVEEDECRDRSNRSTSNARTSRANCGSPGGFTTISTPCRSQEPAGESRQPPRVSWTAGSPPGHPHQQRRP